MIVNKVMSQTPNNNSRSCLCVTVLVWLLSPDPLSSLSTFFFLHSENFPSSNPENKIIKKRSSPFWACYRHQVFQWKQVKCVSMLWVDASSVNVHSREWSRLKILMHVRVCSGGSCDPGGCSAFTVIPSSMWCSLYICQFQGRRVSLTVRSHRLSERRKEDKGPV